MARYGISTYGATTGLSAGQIKNMALFELGFPDEIDFEDTSNPTVEKVNRIYSTTLLAELSNYPWRFILKREELTSRTDATDVNKYKYNYVLPANLLAVRKGYFDADYMNPIRQYESTPKNFNTDATKVYLWYYSLVDEEEFPQYFINYFKYRLAAELCFNLTGDTDLEAKLIELSRVFLLKAKNIDAKQLRGKTVLSSPFTQIRGR